MMDTMEQPYLVISGVRRRHCIAMLLGALALRSPLVATAATPTGTTPHTAKRLLVVGDSLSAEYGLERGTGWVALLGQKLKESEDPSGSMGSVEVINASISGDTTSGGRARLAALLERHKPSHVIVELGGNDALRGLPLAQTEDNLSAMVRMARQAGAKVMLLGMQVPPNYGRSYAETFAGLYAKVARSEHTALVPFFLAGIADDAEPLRWFQADRIHPVQAAHPKILATIWPTLKPWLGASAAPRAK
ncbi:MAG: arylesterase [Leptothrix ochracea]|uniref:arylesterase n=1 Tax=Leptothrix ochracea TaxID=735331 RepID=UPI0034E1D224